MPPVCTMEVVWISSSMCLGHHGSIQQCARHEHCDSVRAPAPTALSVRDFAECGMRCENGLFGGGLVLHS